MEEEQRISEEPITDDSEDVETGAVDPGYANEQEAHEVSQEKHGSDENYTDSMRKRIHQQAKKHAREMRQMQEHLMRMQEQISGGDDANPQHSYNQNTYSSPGQPNPPGMSEEEKIHRAVRYALGAKEHEERQAKEAEGQAHVHSQYRRLNDEFDRASDKYDDFDDVVRGDHVPFTSHVRDALLLVENPSEVAYRLGKNKSELERISKLHPLDQAREVNKLSFSLMSGNHDKSSNTTRSNPMGSIKENPAHSSSAITDKTPASTIRARMKAGTWK